MGHPLTLGVHEHHGAPTCMAIGPRRLLAMALVALGLGTAGISIQRSEWMLTFAASSMSMALLVLLWMGATTSDPPTVRSSFADDQGGPSPVQVDAVNSDLPDPLEHGFDMPF